MPSQAPGSFWFWKQVHDSDSGSGSGSDSDSGSGSKSGQTAPHTSDKGSASSWVPVFLPKKRATPQAARTAQQGQDIWALAGLHCACMKHWVLL